MVNDQMVNNVIFEILKRLKNHFFSFKGLRI